MGSVYQVLGGTVLAGSPRLVPEHRLQHWRMGAHVPMSPPVAV